MATKFIDDDTVCVFQPSCTAFGGYPITAAKARFGLIEPTNAFQIIGQGGPVPEECIPESMTLKTVGDRMPDFWYRRDCEIIVSSRAREVLDQLVPGAIQYIEIKLEIDPSMQPANAYYYINVLPKLRMIDMAASKFPAITLPSHSDGVCYGLRIGNKDIKFKAHGHDDCKMWHEASEDFPRIRNGIKGYVLVRGDLWKTLDARFPGQLSDWIWV